MKIYKNRQEVPDKYKWDLSSFFKDEEEFEKVFATVTDKIKEFKKYIGCTKNSSKLREFLELEFQVEAMFEDLYVYAYLINDQELGVEKSIKRKNKTVKLSEKLDNALSFFAPELLKLSKDEYQALFNDEKLNEYKALLDDIYREKDHILNENEEIMISKLVHASNNFSDISSTMLNREHFYGYVNIDGQKIEVTATNYRKLIRNKDEKVRKKVYNSFHKVLEQYANTSASLLNSYIQLEQTNALLHHYHSSWDAKLFSSELSDEVYKSLCQSVDSNLEPLHHFYALKKDILGLDVLHSYDVSLPLSNANKEYSIEEAQQLVLASLEPLQDDYLQKFKKIINNRYIDYCEYKGKCSGGYSFDTLRQDSRILLSFNGNLDSVSTIAHEAGHNVHGQFLKEANPLQYRGSYTVICEVASLTNEFLLSLYLASHGKTKMEKLAGLENMLNVIENNLYGAVREGIMEQQMYDKVLSGQTLTKEYLNDLSYHSIKRYMGPSVKVHKYAKNGWITRSHYYNNFYLFSYAICVSVALVVAKEISAHNEEMLSKYLEFLKAGSSKSPMEIYAILGIRIDEDKVYKEAISYFDDLLNEYRKISEGDDYE